MITWRAIVEAVATVIQDSQHLHITAFEPI